MAIYGIGNDYTGLPGVEELIRRAKSGDVSMARLILEDYVAAVLENTIGDSIENGRPHKTASGIETRIDERVVRYLAEAFQLIISGVSPEKALGIKPGTGGRPKNSEARDRSIALDVAVLIQQGEPATAAYATVADNYKFKSESGVRKLYKAHKSTVDIVAAQLLKRKKLRG